MMRILLIGVVCFFMLLGSFVRSTEAAATLRPPESKEKLEQKRIQQEEIEFYEDLATDPSGLPRVGKGDRTFLNQDRYLDLETCLKLAMERQGEIQANNKSIESAYWKAKETYRGGIPGVKYQYRLAPVPQDLNDPLTSFFSGDITVFNSLKLEVGAPITTFGQIDLGRDLANLGITQALENKRDKMNEVAYKVHQLYYGLLLANQIQQLMQSAVTAFEENIKKAEAEEFVDQVQILKFKTVAFELYKQLDESNQKQELAKRALRIQLGYSQNSDIDFKMIELRPVKDKIEDFDTYWHSAEEKNVKRRLLDAGVAAKKDLYDLEKRKLAPTLAWGGFFEIGAAPYVSGEDNDSSFSRPFNYKKAGVGLQLEGSFDWVSARAKIRQAQTEYYKILLQKKTGIDGIELELREAYLDARNKRRLMDRSKEAQQISQQVVFLTKGNLDIGIGEKKDYTDSLQSYLLFQGRYYEAVYNYNMAVVRLKQLSGRLSDQLRALTETRAAQGKSDHQEAALETEEEVDASEEGVRQ